MPTLRSEDAGRNMRSPWLGPTNAWRWWFDLDYVLWAVGLVAFAAFGTLFWLVLPAAVPALILVRALAGLLARQYQARYLARLLRCEPAQAPRRARRIVTVVLGGFLALLWPSWHAWALPMSLPASILAALGAAIVFVRRVRPWIDGNRPVPYWIDTLRHIANGPRPVRPAVEAGFGSGPMINTIALDDDLADFLAGVLAVDLEEIHVINARLKTDLVQAMLWDSRTGDTETCEDVVAWLRAKEVSVETLGIDYREGLRGRVRVRVRIRIGERAVLDGRVLVLGTDGTVEALSPAEFATAYEEAK